MQRVSSESDARGGMQGGNRNTVVLFVALIPFAIRGRKLSVLLMMAAWAS